MIARLEGIYGILPADLEERDLIKRAEAALRGGIRILQYRDKKQEYRFALNRAKKLKNLTNHYDAIFIVNDNVELAVDSGADGVHLGLCDIPDFSQLRNSLSQEMLVGISCKGDIDLAKRVFECGANYVAFGSIFPTTSKADVTVIGSALVANARLLFPGKNIVAIGGITMEMLTSIRMSGADSAAIISALFEPASGIEERAAAMVRNWKRTH